MKKITVVTVMVVLMFAFATAAFADGIKCNSVNDAEEYFTHGETALAKSCIEDIIKAEPGNTRAHFAKGKYALMTGEPAIAKTKFSAGDVRAKYGDDIFKTYKDLGDTATKDGNVTAAGNLYEEALVYKPSVRQSLANEMFEAGKKSSNPRGYFSIAIRLDASIAQKTAQIWNGLSQKAPNEDAKIGMLREAAQDDPARFKHAYDDSAKNAGMRHLTAAKKYAKQFDMKTGKGMDAETAREKALAKKYLGEAVVESELPEAKEYNANSEKYRFPLIAGEQTTYWIKIDGFDTELFSEKECQFDRLYEDGYVAKKGESRSQNKTIKFKLRAYSTCTQNNGIGLLVN